jgi:hypothetical protein
MLQCCFALRLADVNMTRSVDTQHVRENELIRIKCLNAKITERDAEYKFLNLLRIHSIVKFI